MIKAKVHIEDRDTGLNKIKRDFKSGAVDVGVFGDKDSDVVIYAATNEFGTDRAGRNKNVVIPQRSFLRGGIDEKREDIRSKIDQGKRQIIQGKMTTRRFLEGLGIYISDKIIIERINRSYEWAAENKPSTIRQKTKAGKVGDQPLVGITGRLKQSIKSRVVGVT